MATSFMKREFTATTQMLEVIREGLPRGASIGNAVTLLHIFDICGDSGIVAKDLEVLTGESAPTVSRMIKTFTEGSLIVYQQYENLGPKIIFLTEKGQALKQRVYLAKENTDSVWQLQQELVDGNVSKRVQRDKAAERKDIQAQYKAQGRGPKGEILGTTEEALGVKADIYSQIKGTGEVGEVNVEVNDWMDDTDHQREAKRRAQIADALAYHSGSMLKAEIFKLKAGRSSYVTDQIIRSRRMAVKRNANGFDWRRHNMEVFSPTYGYHQKNDLQRELLNGVWFYYNLDEEIEKHLPVAVQRDFDDREFTKFLNNSKKDLDDAAASPDGKDTFSMVMKDIRAILNTVQYNKARDALTRHVAKVATHYKKIWVKSDHELAEAEQKAKALRSFATTPQIPLAERQQFDYDANAAERQASEAREENANLKDKVNAQQAQIDELFKLLGGKND